MPPGFFAQSNGFFPPGQKLAGLLSLKFLKADDSFHTEEVSRDGKIGSQLRQHYSACSGRQKPCSHNSCKNFQIDFENILGKMTLRARSKCHKPYTWGVHHGNNSNMLSARSPGYIALDFRKYNDSKVSPHTQYSNLASVIHCFPHHNCNKVVKSATEETHWNQEAAEDF